MRRQTGVLRGRALNARRVSCRARCPAVARKWRFNAFLGHVSPEDGLSSLRRPRLRRAWPSTTHHKQSRCTSPHFSIPPYTGGREGQAMLNRTNRTLSANSFGLNQGTRSFARISGNNMVHQTSQLRHLHHVITVVDPVRAGIVVGPKWPCGSVDPMCSIPASSPASSRALPSSEMPARFQAVAVAFPVERPVVSDDRMYSTGKTGGQVLSKPMAQNGHPAVKPQPGAQRWARAQQVPVARRATGRMSLAAAAAAMPGAASGG
jgi:hypothetical protein